MKLSEFRSELREMVPGATKAKISDTRLNVLINNAVKVVNYEGKILRAEKYFDALIDIKTYELATTIDDYVLIGEGGLWYNRGSVASPEYEQLDAVDRMYLDKRYPNWVNADSGRVNYYFIEVNNLIVSTAPPATLTNGFYMPDYVKKPVNMTNDDHYPFTGSETEYAFLQPLDDAISAYVRWKLKYSVGSDQKGIATQQEYQSLLNLQLKLVKRRPDFINSRKYRYRGK